MKDAESPLRDIVFPHYARVFSACPRYVNISPSGFRPVCLSNSSDMGVDGRLLCRSFQNNITVVEFCFRVPRL